MNKSLEKLWNTKKKDLDASLIVSVWLDEFFGSDYETVEKLIYENNPKDSNESEEDYKERLSRIFFKDYQVTKEQLDWWEKEIKKCLIKKFRYNKHILDRGWWSIYLDTAPSLKSENI